MKKEKGNALITALVAFLVVILVVAVLPVINTLNTRVSDISELSVSELLEELAGHSYVAYSAPSGTFYVNDVLPNADSTYDIGANGNEFAEGHFDSVVVGGSEVLTADGTEGLTANWDVGSHEVRAQTFESDVATGTAPFTIASTTTSTNLSSDLVDGYQMARGTEYVVAASDSSATAKAQADAICDGINDEIQIQYGIDTYNGVYLRDGTYTLSATIDLTTDNAFIVGESRDTILVGTEGLTAIKINNPTNFGGIRIAHLSLDGDFIGHTAIYHYDGSRNFIEDCEIYDWDRWGLDAEYNHTLIVRSCHIHSCGDSTDMGGLPYVGGIKVGGRPGTRDVPFSALHVSDTLIEWNYDGVWIIQGLGTSFRDTCIEGNNRYGVILDQDGGTNALPQLVTFDNCFFEQNNAMEVAGDIADIYGTEAVFNLDVRDCYFTGTYVDWGVRIGAGGYAVTVSITGCLFKSSGSQHPVFLSGCFELTFMGNRLNAAGDFANCRFTTPVSIGQWTDADDAFTTVENSATCDGFPLHVPRGTHEFSEKFVVPSDNISIVGDGPESVLKLANGLDDNLIYADGKSGLRLFNFAIDGNRANNAAADPVHLNACSHSSIERLTVHDADDYGVKLVACSYIDLTDLYIYDCDSHCLYMHRTTYCDVDSGVYNSAGADGIYILGDATANADYNIVHGTICTGNTDDGIAISGTTDANKNIISNCHLLGNGTALEDNGTATVNDNNVTS